LQVASCLLAAKLSYPGCSEVRARYPGTRVAGSWLADCGLNFEFQCGSGPGTRGEYAWLWLHTAHPRIAQPANRPAASVGASMINAQVGLHHQRVVRREVNMPHMSCAYTCACVQVYSAKCRQLQERMGMAMTSVTTHVNSAQPIFCWPGRPLY